MRSTFLLLGLVGASVAQVFTCQASSSIPYCVHAPEGAGALPMMVFMPGSGARGDLSNAASLATYDGLGKLINEYAGGNTDEAHTIAATKFLAVVPISPDGTRHFWPEDIKGIIKDVRKKYKVKGSKVGISGYSMGARGCNRFSVTYPELVASAGCSAGAAEQDGDSTLTQDPSRTASATFPLLSKAAKLNMMLFAGMSDETAGYTSTEAEVAKLKELGSTTVQLVELQGATHSDMSTKPWTDTDYMKWALAQASSSAGSTSSSKTKSTSPSKSKSTSPSKTKALAPTATAELATSDDEDCEEEESETEDSSSSDLDDCEEDSDSPETDEDDCEEEAEPEEEDCEDDESTSAESKRSLPELDFTLERQAHHFVFPHSKRDWMARVAPALRPRSVIPARHRMVRTRRH